MKWTNEDIDYLKNNYLTYTNKELGKILDRTETAIISKAYELKIKKHEWWTDEDKELLRQLYPIKTNPQLALIFNHPALSIGIMARQLGLKKAIGLHYHDLDKYLEQLKLYADELGRTPLFTETATQEWHIPQMTIYRYIGGYREACKLAGLKLNLAFYNLKREFLYSKNNDLCWSNAEVIITNFFIDNNIPYRREIKYKEFINDKRCNNKNCDWIIYDNVFVEYFGLMAKEFYRVKAEEKMDICKNNNIKLIDLYEKDLNKLNNIFNN